MEMMMQYVWQTGIWGRGRLQAVDGRSIEVVDRGMLNTGPGPDFFNAKVKIDGQMWVGNIEIHVRASDWFRHGHDKDPAYDNVVLHIVAVDDCELRIASRDEAVAQVLMRDARSYYEFYEHLCNRDLPTLGCADRLCQLSSLEVADWLGSLGMERLQRKAGDIAEGVERMNGDWSEASYITLARGLGFGVNADAMERVARAMSLKILSKHADRRAYVEAMLMGQAGLLEPEANGLTTGEFADDYHRYLYDQYKFFATKFSLERPEHQAWRLGGIRPGNSPWRRLAMLAAYVCSGLAGGSRLMNCTDIDLMLEQLDIDSSEYWHRHWRPGVEAPYARHLSVSSRNLLLVNVVLPLMYARAEATGRYDLTAVYSDMLQSIPAEDNRIVRLFSTVGLPVKNAFDSQAIVELYNNYCTSRRCLSCRFAHRLLAKKLKQ